MILESGRISIIALNSNCPILVSNILILIHKLLLARKYLDPILYLKLFDFEQSFFLIQECFLALDHFGRNTELLA